MSYTIGIIGAGNIGHALALHLSKTKYRVIITNSKGPDSLKNLVASVGGHLEAADVATTIREADVLFIAVPWRNLSAIADAAAGYHGKLFVDATNNIISVAPFRLDDIGGKSTGEHVASLFPTHRVVKAFNTLGAATLANPTENKVGKTVIFISGDDEAARKQVAEIAAAMQFAAVDLGSFREAGRLQDVGGALSGVELIKVSK